MHYEFADRQLSSVFAYSDYIQKDFAHFSNPKGLIQLLWNRNDQPVELQIDDLQIILAPYQIITVTFFHKVQFPANSLPLTGLAFNRAFYCIADHDDEVGCNGILFFGTQDLPIINIAEEQRRKFDLLLEVILEEYKTKDKIQGDMLQMLLKRFIIICTRLAKEQLIVEKLDDTQVDTIRQFNVMVDLHFREKHKVRDYAALLYKSPKTLSNLFAVYNQKKPQQIIQERVVLEAKRLLQFTDKQNQEIAYELGFDDPAYFSRYFKKIAGVSPTQYKAQLA